MKRLILIALAGMTLVGCANNDIYSGDVYSANQAKEVQTVTYGTLLSVREIKIQGGNNENVAGTLGGAVLGGILGSAVGGGTGRALATAGGAIAGGIAGDAIQGKANQSKGLELEIRTDGGETIVVVQKADVSKFSVGQRVRIASSNSQTTVSPR